MRCPIAGLRITNKKRSKIDSFNAGDIAVDDVDVFRLGVFREAGHAHDVAGDGNEKPGARRNDDFLYGDGESCGAS